MTDPGFRDRMLDLARKVHAAPDDGAALEVMREHTGLSITDPEADRRELDRRVAANRAAGGDVWYLADCADCPQSQPFRVQATRDGWAQAHHTGTGHQVTPRTEFGEPAP